MNSSISKLQAITTQDMSREEFLKLLGASALAVIGAWGLLNNLRSLQNPRFNRDQSYGSRVYGR